MIYLIVIILVIVILLLVWKGFLGERAKMNEPPLPPKADPPLAETPPIPRQIGEQGENEPPLTPPISQSETGGEQIKGICKVAVGRDKVREENKQKILEFLRQKGRASNTDIRELLGVADRTAVDYMDELEKDGKVKQVGETGRWTYYELK